MNVLFVARDYSRWKNGGSVVTLRNLSFLKKLPNVSVTELLLPHSKANYLLSILTDDVYGGNWDLNQKFNLKLRQADVIWFDGSLFGKWVKKARLKNKLTICFCHNIEKKYYKARLECKKSLLNKILYNYVTKNEAMSFEYADEIIMLNDRDAEELQKIYKRRRSFLLPTSFKPINIDKDLENVIKEPYLLFVGSIFFANIEGISWFIKNVTPRIKYNVVLVGSICEAFKNDTLPSNVILTGIVDNLYPYYLDATAVVSPIFSGSGTKTKTIEALAYHKTIIGSKEAFIGVPENRKACILCENSEDYIREINNLDPANRFNIESTKVFKENFCEDTIFNKFERYWTSNISTNLST